MNFEEYPQHLHVTIPALGIGNAVCLLTAIILFVRRRRRVPDRGSRSLMPVVLLGLLGVALFYVFFISIYIPESIW
jgi:hypothetical protein